MVCRCARAVSHVVTGEPMKAEQKEIAWRQAAQSTENAMRAIDDAHAALTRVKLRIEARSSARLAAARRVGGAS